MAMPIEAAPELKGTASTCDTPSKAVTLSARSRIIKRQRAANGLCSCQNLTK
jgi:hypothetical protein